MSSFCTTYSKFLYGFEVSDENNLIDFDEGAGALQAEIEIGSYTLGNLADAVAAALNDAGLNTYAVSVNRATRKITITVTGTATDFLFNTGLGAAASAAEILGFNETDRSNVSTLTSDNAMGTLYSPQFMLQSYVPSVNSQQAAFATRNKSATGAVQVQRFGVESFMKCEIQYATDIPQPGTSPIINNASGVDDLRDFMEALTNQMPVEFFVDRNDTETFESLILESSSESKDGVGFELKEMRSYKLRGYFETGRLIFRVID